MSGEVICLSSEEDDASAFNSKSSKRTLKGEQKAQKRKWSPAAASSQDNTKKLQVEKKTCNFPKSISDDIEGKKRQVIKPQLVVKQKVPIPTTNEDVFQNFIKTCLERRDDKDAKKVLHKLEKQYNKLSLLQKDDDEFRLFVGNCHDRITKNLSNDIYTPALDLYNEIKRRVQINPVQEQQAPATGAAAEAAAAAADTGENAPDVQVSKEDMKKIRLLEKSINECLKKIKELEEKEVDFDDDNDSAYIQEDKYKKRLIRLCNALSKISQDKVLKKQILKKKIKRKDIVDEMTGISSVDEAILNFVNSDVGKINQMKYLETQRCADHIKMPEYLDILKCIAKCNQEANLDLSKEKMTKLAKRAFQTVGNFLKKKRMDETKFYMQSLIDDDTEDPAVKDVGLNQKLQKNKTEGDKKLEEIFKKYVDKQEGLSQEDMEEQAKASSEESECESVTDNSDGNLSSATDDQKVSSVDKVDDKNSELDSNLVVAEKDEKILCTTESTSSSIDENDNKQDNNSDKQDTEIEFQAESTNKEEKNALVIAADQDDDILVMSENDDLDADSTRAKQDPLFINQASTTAVLQAESKDGEILQINDTADCTEMSESVVAKQIDSDKAKTSFIKVCAFAKPPPAWGDLSPEKVKKKLQFPSFQRALRNSPPPPPRAAAAAAAATPKPVCIDLTRDRKRQTPISRPLAAPPTTSARSINPMANIKRTSPPVKRVVIVKNVINNYNVPLSAAAAATPADQGGSSNDYGNIVRTSWLSKADKADKAAAAATTTTTTTTSTATTNTNTKRPYIK